MCHVRGLSIPPPALFQLPGHNPPSCSCLGSLTQVAQPAYQAQALCPDEGGGEELPDLVHYNLQLLVRHLPPQRPGLGCQLGELMVEFAHFSEGMSNKCGAYAGVLPQTVVIESITD